MKKFLVLFLLSIFSLSVFSQTPKNTLTFLGFPVDGTKEKMIQNLNTKGFVYDSRNDVLTGRFNGRNVNVFISTNYGKVDRIFVSDYAETERQSEIINAFNILVKQFQENPKYQELLPNDEIKNDENIYHKIMSENERYQASFYTKTPFDTLEVTNPINDYVASKYPKEKIDLMTEKEKEDAESEIIYMYLKEVEKRMTGNVWFMINYHLGEYSIGIYYDNLNNRPKGEDL